MKEFIQDLDNTLAWVGASVGLMVLGVAILGFITPGKLRAQVSDSLNAAVLVAFKVLSVAIIISVQVYNAPDDLSEGLTDVALYGLLALVLSTIAFMVIDGILPAKIRELVNEKQFDPAVLVAATAEIAVALVVAAAST